MLWWDRWLWESHASEKALTAYSRDTNNGKLHLMQNQFLKLWLIRKWKIELIQCKNFCNTFTKTIPWDWIWLNLTTCVMCVEPSTLACLQLCLSLRVYSCLFNDCCCHWTGACVYAREGIGTTCDTQWTHGERQKDGGACKSGLLTYAHSEIQECYSFGDTY